MDSSFSGFDLAMTEGSLSASITKAVSIRLSSFSSDDPAN